MRVSHLKPGGRTRETGRTRLVPLINLIIESNDRNHNNNHLVPNSASMFGHFDDRLSVPYRI